jgi:HPt (histidine-containing phosphotransfer) domain-containing protein
MKKLLENPEAEISQLCQKLELEFIPSMINYGEQNHPQWRFGDPKNLYENTKPNSQHSDHWKHSLKDAQTWQVVNDYLAILGEETITQMGYSYEELQEIIQTYCPSTLSLKELLEIPITQQKQG